MNAKTRLGLLALCSLLSACTVVEPGQRAVKVSLGKMDPNLLTPGMQTYFPLTDSIIPYSVKQENATGQWETLTADQQPITINFNVLYRIPEGQVLTLYEKYAGNQIGRASCRERV